MTLEAEAAADYVQTEAPRLVKVAGATAISFALFDGANRALCLANQQDVHDDAWQTALGYRGDAVSLTVVRLALLLDRDTSVISFQHIYSSLKRADPRARKREQRTDLAVKRAFYRLADENREIILVACNKCDWRAAFARDELIAAHGADYPMPNLLNHLAAPDCPRLGSTCNRCGVHYVEPIEGAR
jgi:hypothetical protein